MSFMAGPTAINYHIDKATIYLLQVTNNIN